MQRRIVDFQQDDQGDWAAVLDCWHGRHFRHQPPWTESPWVQTSAGRASQIGTTLDCPKCEWIELPDNMVLDRTTPEWTDATLPVGLQRAHRVAGGVWGRVRVLEGSVRFEFDDDLAPSAETIGVLGAGQSQLIPPDRPHHLEVIGPVRLVVDFLVR